MNLLILAPCERLIVERGANVISLISILEEITPSLPAGAAELQENAIAPQPWYVLTLWSCDEAEVGSRFQVRLDVVDPRGQTKWQLTSPVVEFKRTKHRHIFTIRGFPIGLTGTYELRVATREDREESDFTHVATYPIIVKAPSLEPARA
jgi:hypothetical protein